MCIRAERGYCNTLAWKSFANTIRIAATERSQQIERSLRPEAKFWMILKRCGKSYRQSQIHPTPILLSRELLRPR